MLLAAVVAMTVSFGLVPTASASDATVADRIFTLLNKARADNGLPPLKRVVELDSVAQAWSQQQAAESRMYHNPYYSEQYPSGWRYAAENVAYTGGTTPSGDRFHELWMNSPGHRANILNPNFTHVGVGVATKGDRTYATQNFAQYPTSVTLTPTQPTLTSAPTTPVERWSGADRYAVSAKVSAANFDPGVRVAYVANGLTSVDALSAAPVAGMNDAPVLLTRPGSLPAEVAAELKRLRPQRIVILGGTGAVSSGVQSQLRSYSGTVDRWSGADRYEVSAAVSRANFSAGEPVVYVANGQTSVDALSAAPVAGMQGAPVLLTQAGTLPGAVAQELKRLAPRRIVVLGGIGAVSSGVERQLASYAGSVSRWSGADRYAVSAAVSKGTFSAGAPVVYVANGLTSVDALSAAPVAGMNGAPVLLTQPGALPTSVLAELRRLDPGRVVVLGGTGAVGTSVESQLARLG
ncbi:hypothetical protein GCM10022262_12710 [Georgenia daeguensis]|uniref:SCP domain-containing protein n=1 Tax=Georgenia daeguensis TaxID=908355 RepID=A0ABP8EST0_9MICO